LPINSRGQSWKENGLHRSFFRPIRTPDDAGYADVAESDTGSAAKICDKTRT